MQVTEPTSEVPDHIRPNHLIKELTKETRYLEVRTKEGQRGWEAMVKGHLGTFATSWTSKSEVGNC